MSILNIDTDIVTETVEERYLFGQPYGDNINEFIIRCDDDRPTLIGKLVAKAPCLCHAKYDYGDIHKNYMWQFGEVFSKNREIGSPLIRTLQKSGWRIPSASWYEMLLGRTKGEMYDGFYFNKLIEVFRRIEGMYPKKDAAEDYNTYIPNDFWTCTWLYEDREIPWSIKPTHRRVYNYVDMTPPDMIFSVSDDDLRDQGIRGRYYPLGWHPDPEYPQGLSLLMIKNV